MNILNQIFSQAKNLYLSMSQGTRVIAILMTIAIIISCGFLVQETKRGSMELLLGGHLFKDADLQQAEFALSSAGLRQYERDGNRLRIPTSQKDQYLKALAEGKAFPKDLGGSLQDALNGGNFLEPLTTTKTRILAAKQRDIAEAIMRLPFVEIANVQYDERREGFATQLQSTASVWVLPKPGMALVDQHKRNIMRQVQATFAGLRYENISVMDLSSGSALTGENDPLTAEQQQYYLQKSQVEQDIKRKAMNLLSDYGDVRMEVNVELDPTLREETEKLQFADKPVTVQTTTTKRDSESAKASTGGRPGTEPNALVNRSASLNSSPEQSSKSKEQQESERKIVGRETTMTAKVGLQIRNATLSVSLPVSFYKRQWQDQYPTKTISDMTAAELSQLKTEVKDKIQLSLAAILPMPVAGTNPLLRVTVTDYLDVPIVPIPPQSIVTTIVGWLATQWQSIAVLGLGVAALLSIRSFAKVGSGVDDSAFDRGFDIPLDDVADLDLDALGDALNDGDGDGNGSSSEHASGGSGPRKSFSSAAPSGNEIRQQLSDMVRENPDAAATLLKSWIGEAT